MLARVGYAAVVVVPRILSRGEWYDPISPSALYETEFESLVIFHAPSLYPHLYVAEFKTLIGTDAGYTAKADLALIDKQYRCWWVVEAEMANHSLHRHVLPQVRSLSQGIYGESEAAYLQKKNARLDLARLVDMMKGRQPQVLVIVNAPMPAWSEPLLRYEALLAVFEVFRSQRNEYLFRVNGDQPAILTDVVSSCRFDRVLPRLLRLESPSALNVGPRETLNIYVDSQLTVWQRIDAQDCVWLSPIGPNPLTPGLDYDLLRREDGAFIFRPRQR